MPPARRRTAAAWAANKKAGMEKESAELASDWESYADGRIFSGTEAKRLGFVDELGNFDVAVKRAKKLPPGWPSPLGRCGAPLGSAALLSPSSALPAGSTRFLLMVNV